MELSHNEAPAAAVSLRWLMPLSPPELGPLSRCEPVGLATLQTALAGDAWDSPGVLWADQIRAALRHCERTGTGWFSVLGGGGDAAPWGPGVNAVCRALFQAAAILAMKALQAPGSP